MTQNIDLNKYTEFVNAVTSKESNNFDHLLPRIVELRNTTNINVSLLLTACLGLAAESGEFIEIPK